MLASLVGVLPVVVNIRAKHSIALVMTSLYISYLFISSLVFLTFSKKFQNSFSKI